MLPFVRVLALFGLVVPAFGQSTWYIDDDGIPPGSGTVTDPYTSIQYAIDQPATAAGDTLIVRGGTYHEDVHLAGKALAIYGDPQDRPRIEGAGVYSAALLAPAGQPPGTIVEDFVIAAHPSGSQRAIELESQAELRAAGLMLERGWDPYQSDSAGGQVRLRAGSQLELTSSTLRAVEDIQRGGAIAVDGAVLLLVDCDLTGAFGGSQGRGGILDVEAGTLIATGTIFRDGFVEDIGDFGGAVALLQANATFVQCQFLDAFALQAAGGALFARDSVVTLEGSLFDQCRAVQGPGGALLFEGGVLTASASEFHGCAAFAGDGGAVYLDPTAVASFEGCTFRDNTTDGDLAWGLGNGGAIYANALAEFRSSLFAGNVADGVPGFAGADGEGGAIYGGGTVQSCTFFSNRAGNLAKPGLGGAIASGTVDSSIVWRSFPVPFGAAVAATYSNVHGGWPGTGNLDVEPRFMDLEGGIYELATGSRCIDAANPALPLDADETPADQGAFPYTWMEVGASYCAANPNSSGAAAVITALGTTTLSERFLRLRARQLPLGQIGFFLMSKTQDFVPFVGGGEGNLCLGSPILRLTEPPAGGMLFSGSTGGFDLATDLLAMPLGQRPQAGETWHFQAWFRDQVGSTTTSNLTDARTIAFD